MNLKIMKDNLNTAIQQVSKAISSRSTIQILSGIKLDIQPNGVVLTASDTEISIQSFIPLEEEGMIIAEVYSPCSVVLPAKFFTEIIRKLPAQDVYIEVKEQFLTMIRSGTAEVQIGLHYALAPLCDRGFSLAGHHRPGIDAVVLSARSRVARRSARGGRLHADGMAQARVTARAWNTTTKPHGLAAQPSAVMTPQPARCTDPRT